MGEIMEEIFTKHNYCIYILNPPINTEKKTIAIKIILPHKFLQLFLIIVFTDVDTLLLNTYVH